MGISPALASIVPIVLPLPSKGEPLREGYTPSKSVAALVFSCLAKGRYTMSVGTILLILFVLFLVGALPAWPHSRQWGYYPSGGLGLVVVILLILVILGRI